MAEPRERPLHELLSRDMVDIYVGPENTHWVLHEKLLCHRSKHFRDIFYAKKKKSTSNTANANTKVYGLPDEEDEPFNLFVAWLYANTLPTPKEEKELAPLLDLYLMAEKWGVKALVVQVLETVRAWYYESDTWPGLRRVQYIYANTEAGSPMRQLLVSCVARMLVVGNGSHAGGAGAGGGGGIGMPPHWEKALRKNGEMAVDIIVCVQGWRLEGDKVPDSRHGSMQELVEGAEERREMVAEERGDIARVSGAVEDEEHDGQGQSGEGEEHEDEQEAEGAAQQQGETES
ncbi:hypothetical protein BDY17DRAFT_305925 [Neohortaea acidophila]|uniref:BTB domain-containing protein n=1 Tax=Neohortaea acidophila TaxID=245834 RepID=A0A6A6PFU0_9PEZI|nr:uncharacterized protein BDY17DRAFT_305925 [Neohortaea acidophila]KAF2478840.1 hypothetical protein BDY17DRAFT_305925 [Neohortaea acidophila]